MDKIDLFSPLYILTFQIHFKFFYFQKKKNIIKKKIRRTIFLAFVHTRKQLGSKGIIFELSLEGILLYEEIYLASNIPPNSRS